VRALLLGAALSSAACGTSGDQSSCTGTACVDAASGQAGTAAIGGAAAAPAAAGAGAGADVDAGPPEPVPAGACVPQGPRADQLGATRAVLYAGERALGAVAVQRQGVFVADADAGIFRIDPGGTALERVVSARTSEFLAADLNLYWFESGSIHRASLNATDATPDPVAEGLPAMITLGAFDETNLYAHDGARRQLSRLPIAGGTALPLASGVRVQGMKLHAGFLYYSELDAAQVFRLRSDGGDPQQLTSESNASLGAVETDGTTLYWSTGIQIRAAALDPPVTSKPLGVGGPRAQGGRGSVTRALLVGDRPYWSDREGSLGWTAVDGSVCALVVSGVTQINGWDVDDSAVYLSTAGRNATSELWRIAL